jgi:hypothetical protein
MAVGVLEKERLGLLEEGKNGFAMVSNRQELWR